MKSKIILGLAALSMSGLASAAVDCAAPLPQAAPSPTYLSPIAPELATPLNQIAAQTGVLTQVYDDSLSVEKVLLRIGIEKCQSIAKAVPMPGAVSPNDPAAYKARTEFDNTPWRFNMSGEGGKRMTADEFDAWMKSRGIRVAKGNAATAVPAAMPATMPGNDPNASAPTTQQPAAAPQPSATNGQQQP